MGSVAPIAANLVGRELEASALGELLAKPAQLPQAVVLEGDAGIGKTTLWRHALELARTRSLAILAAVPAAAEAELALAGLGDLLEPVVDRVSPGLPEPQARALRVALLREEPVGEPADPRAIGTALLGSLRLLATKQPVLVAVDDVQWLDAATSAALEYALRRLRDEPVAVLVARRSSGKDPLPLGLAGCSFSVERLQLSPLSLGAVHRLLVTRLGVELARPALRRLHETSGGNPFFALELARELSKQEAGSWEPLPLPDTLDELVESRLARLPDETRRALRTAAALAHPTVGLLAAALGDGVEAALEPAFEAQVAALDAGRIVFDHPLLASASYGWREHGRRDLHAQLAEIVDDVDERAHHLALATESPEESVAALVEEAAVTTFRRGAPAAAANLVAHARRLTPTDEPDALQRRGVLQAGYAFESGDSDSASSLLEELVDTAAPGPNRARLLSSLARVRHFRDNVGGGVDLLERALAESGDDAQLRAEIQEGLAWGMLLARRDLRVAAAHAREAARTAEARSDPAALAEALAAQALTELVVGGDGEDAMRRALVLEPATRGLRVLRQPSFAWGYLLSCTDRLGEARSVFLDLRRRAEESGDESALAPIFNHLALIECLAGSWDAAEAYAEEGLALARQSAQLPTQASILGKAALVAARRGDPQTTREAADTSLGISGGAEFDPLRPAPALTGGGETALWARGSLELAVGRLDGADRYLRPLVTALVEAGVAAPGELRALPDAVETLVGLGRAEDAEDLLRPYEQTAVLHRQPSAVGAARRCRALLTAHAGRLDEATAVAEAAVAALAASDLPFEHARALFSLGEVRRRAKQKRSTRDAFERARAAFDALGADGWAQRAEDELRRISGRARADGLTATERRVADLVSEGLSNKEVAAALFVTVKTVETHLSHIYAKLGIRSRAQLARRAASQGEPKL